MNKRQAMLKNFNDMKDQLICKININCFHFGADGFFELHMQNGKITYVSSLKKGGTVEDFCYYTQGNLQRFLKTKEGKAIQRFIKEKLVEEALEL